MQHTYRNYIITSLLAIAILMISACEDEHKDSRSQVLYANSFCAPALSTENSDTLFLRAYYNFAATSNDHSAFSIFSQECNIMHVSSEASAFIRQLFTLNDMPTDEAMCAWDDSGIFDICLNRHDRVEPNLKSAEGMYIRLMCGILICNKYLNLNIREDTQRKAEIRFLRALNYYYLLDLFGKAPIFKVFTKDTSKVSSSAELYNFIESELIEILPFLQDGKLLSDFDEEYGRANKEAAHMLLARLYLNAKTYIGEPQWEKAAREATIVINGPYELSSTALTNKNLNATFNGYQLLFTADNGSNGANFEIILPIKFDAETISEMGGTTFLISSIAAFDTRFLPDIPGLGLKNQWSGNRARANLVTKFLTDSVPTDAYHPTMIEWAHDDRALFNSVNRRLSCHKRSLFEDGLSVVKFTDFYTSRPMPHVLNNVANSDFPLMRLAEAYLTLAEAEWRMGNTEEALKNINIIRNRAHAIPMTEIDTEGHAILDEWAREFYFEGRRRTDLIRFDCYGGDNDYLWQWKGGTILGRDFDVALNKYSLPVDSLILGKKTNAKLKMYYMIGNGIGNNGWNTEGGENIGRGIAPMSFASDNKLQYTDWFPANASFKMFRDFNSWEEQFGAGEYPGEVSHNQSGSGNFTVEEEGLHRITLIPDESKVSITPLSSQDYKTYDMLVLWVNHGKKEMKRYSNNPNTHVWCTDFVCEGGEIALKITKTMSAKDPINLNTCLLYGIDSSIDNRGHILLHTEAETQKIRVVYNDLDNSFFSFKLDDMAAIENEIAQDINLQLQIDRSYKSNVNACALRHKFNLPERAIINKIRIGLTKGADNMFGTEICDITNSNNSHEGTTIISQDRIQEALNKIQPTNTYKFSISVEFSLYGDTWTAINYSSTGYM